MATDALRADDDEKAVIAICVGFSQEGDLEEVVARLSVDDFFLDETRAIFRAIAALHERGEPTLLTRVLDQARRDGSAVAQRAPTLLALWCSDLATSAFLPDHVERVRRAADRRRLLAAAHQVAVLAADSDTDDATAFRVSAEVVSLSAPPMTRGPRVRDQDEGPRELATYREKSEARSLGLSGLDVHLLGGIRPGQMLVVGGRTGMGKSALLRQFARSLAPHGPVLFCSNEMTFPELFARDTAAMGHLRLADVVEGSGGTALARSTELAARIGIKTFTEPGMTTASIRATALRLMREEPLAAIVVDYIQRIADPGRGDLERVGHAARACKSLALELSVPVLIGSQINRSPEREGPDGRPGLHDLRTSGEIEQEADIVLLLYRAAYYYPTEDDWRRAHPRDSYPGDQAEIILAKHRQGVSGVTIRPSYRASSVLFED